MADTIAIESLRENLQEGSSLRRRGPAGEESLRKIQNSLSRLLEDGEEVLAYADRESKPVEEMDAFAYVPGGPANETDAMAYPRSEANPETDAFRYDTEEARTQPDVLGYAAGGEPEETDAFAYHRPRPGPETNVFMKEPDPGRIAAVDLLLLTNKRLIRGLLENGRLAVTQVPGRVEGVRVIVDTDGEQPGAPLSPPSEACLAVHLPTLLRRPGDGEWWYWRVSADRDPWTVAIRWSCS